MASKLTSTSSDTHKVYISNSGIQHANSLQTVRAKTLKEQLTSDKTPLLNGKEPKEGTVKHYETVQVVILAKWSGFQSHERVDWQT